MSGLLAPEASVTRATARVGDPSTYIVAGGAFLLTAGLAAANGGYFPSSWGWAALPLLCAAVVALLVRQRILLAPLELALGGAVIALAAWTFLSVAWASSRTLAVFEGERSLVLVAAVAAVLAIAKGRAARPLLGGVLAGIVVVCAYALATRLLPERLGSYDSLAGYRLNTPVGYWNGLGLLAAMGALLALGFAARSRRGATAALAAASLPVLLPTLYFTFSRGSWLALGIGLAVALAADPRRLQLTTALAVLALAPAAAVALASRSPALTHQTATLARASHDGHRLLLWLVLLAFAQAGLALLYREAGGRLTVARGLRVVYASALVALLAAAVAIGIARYGSPWHVAHRAYHGFTAPAPNTGANLNARLFNFSGSGRWDLWRVAAHQVGAHPLLGGGAGSYEAYWNRHRLIAGGVVDAHNLYLETLAELGPVGLALLLLLLGIPFAAAVRFRRHPLVPLALGAYAAYLVHAAVDWDWELTGITLAALLIGVACVLAGRADDASLRSISGRVRDGIAVALVALSGFTVVSLLGNAAASASEAAARRGNFASAASHARTAIRWSPWSARGWQDLGEAQLSMRQLGAARRSVLKAIALEPGNWVLWLDLAAAEQSAARQRSLLVAKRLNPLSPEIQQFERP